MDDFRAFVVTVSERLLPEEAEKIAYITELPSAGREPRRALEVLQVLEERDVFSASSLDRLRALMCKIGRNDIARFVEEYRPPPPLPPSPPPLSCSPRQTNAAAPSPCLRRVGRSESEQGTEPTESVGSIERSEGFRARGFSMPSPSSSASLPNCGGRCKSWLFLRKALNEDIYEHKCRPFRFRRSMKVDTTRIYFHLYPPPRLHIILYPSGLDQDRDMYATLEAQVELPRACRGKDASSIQLTLKASVHNHPSGDRILEKVIHTNLNAQKVMMYQLISHDALKHSRSQHIEFKVWAWCSMHGSDNYVTETVEEDFENITLKSTQAQARIS